MYYFKLKNANKIIFIHHSTVICKDEESFLLAKQNVESIFEIYEEGEIDFDENGTITIE